MNFINKKLADITSAGGGFRHIDLRFNETVPILFSYGKKSMAFFTEDSKLYITPKEQKLLRKGIKLNREIKKWDSANSRIVQKFAYYQPNETSLLAEKLEKRFEILNDSFSEVSRNFIGQFSMARLWNLSIVGSIIFGMVIMTFVYRYLGQGAAADQARQAAVSEQQKQVPAENSEVPVAQNSNDEENSFTDQVLEIEKISDEKSLEKEIQKMVKGYPIEKMIPYIVKKDRTVAAFLVAIAYKESTWGVHVPVLNGQDCYNYWGFRGQRMLMGTGGHTCFNSPKDAVDTVAKRMEFLVSNDKLKTPAQMVEPWKCGYDCEATGGRAAANKWVSDVATYFEKLNGK